MQKLQNEFKSDLTERNQKNKKVNYTISKHFTKQETVLSIF